MTDYTDVYLKADSKSAFFDRCDSEGLVSDGSIITDTPNHCIILIGTVYQDTGEVYIDNEGNEQKEKVALDGYFAHVRYLSSIGLDDLELDNSPTKSVFA